MVLAFGLIRLLVKIICRRNFRFRGWMTYPSMAWRLGTAVGLVLLTTLLCAIPACASLWRSDLTAGIQGAGRSVSSTARRIAPEPLLLALKWRSR